MGGGIRSLNVALRQELDLYVCLRPVRWFQGVPSPVKEPQKTDMVIFRENSEDIYAGIEYEAKSDKAKKLIKQIGKELAQDPEVAPHIIETLKMQGVEQFGEFAIQIRMKMMTKPGEQIVIRRRAYAMIKQAFAENGIEIALPTVTVAGGGDSTPAVAQQAIEMTRPPTAAE